MPPLCRKTILRGISAASGQFPSTSGPRYQGGRKVIICAPDRPSTLQCPTSRKENRFLTRRG